MLRLNNEMMYKMFLNTISKMDEKELENALTKAKGLLSENDYNNLVLMIEKEKSKKKEE